MAIDENCFKSSSFAKKKKKKSAKEQFPLHRGNIVPVAARGQNMYYSLAKVFEKLSKHFNTISKVMY